MKIWKISYQPPANKANEKWSANVTALQRINECVGLVFFCERKMHTHICIFLCVSVCNGTYACEKYVKVFLFAHFNLLNCLIVLNEVLHMYICLNMLALKCMNGCVCLCVLVFTYA